MAIGAIGGHSEHGFLPLDADASRRSAQSDPCSLSLRRTAEIGRKGERKGMFLPCEQSVFNQIESAEKETGCFNGRLSCALVPAVFRSKNGQFVNM
jgi:hypothetical protein